MLFGNSGSGKSTTCLAINVPRIDHHDRAAQVWIDPHGQMVTQVAEHCVHRGLHLTGHFLHDQLFETSNVIGSNFLEASTHPDPEQREAFDRQAISEAIAVCVQAEGKTDLMKNPVIRTGLSDAFNLLIRQKTPISPVLLRNAFVGDSEDHHVLCQNCTREGLAKTFRKYGRMSNRDWEFNCGPAHRRLEMLFGSPQFRKRCIATHDFCNFLNDGGIYVVDGTSIGNLSREDARLLMAMKILQVIWLARSGQLTRKVVLIIDEGTNAGLIDMNIARALAEARKWGIEIQLILQNPITFAPPEIRESVFQHCTRQFYLKQVNPDAVDFVTRLCVSRINPWAVHSVETRTRLEHDGYDIDHVVNEGQWITGEGEDMKTGTTSNVNQVARARYRERQEEFIRYMTPEQQRIQIQQEIDGLEVGECIIRTSRGVSNSAIYVPMLLPPFTTKSGRTLIYDTASGQTLANRNWEIAREQMKSRPEYQSVEVVTPSVTKNTDLGMDSSDTDAAVTSLFIDREAITDFADENPVNASFIEQVGDFKNRKACDAWITRQEAVGKLKCVGTMKNGQGRKVTKVYCNGWQPKEDHLAHEVAASWIRRVFQKLECRRGHRVGEFFADLRMTDGTYTWDVECDCGSMKETKVRGRWRKYRTARHAVLIVAAGKRDPEARMRQLMAWSDEIAHIAFFTTLDRLQQHGAGARVWDYIGRGDEPLKRVKLAEGSAF